MTCGACGHTNPDQAKFCLECGTGFALRCATCTTELPAGAKFCLECGTATAPLPSSEPAAPTRAPLDYTPKHLADKILQSKSALEGERKQVTVMFADVKGSMELAEQLDPEEWHRILDRFFEILTEGVHRFEGTVNQYTGDGIMALFGAPIAHEDHAQRACYAALHLQSEIARYATEVKREHGVGFQTRMGLHSGEVVVGSIGDDLRMDYTAQGHSVGLAQRMESLAEPNTCYLTAATGALAGGYFELEDLGEFRVKGVDAAVEVRRLVGLGSARTRFDRSRARGLSRFVGRAADVRMLEDAIEQSAAGEGQVVGVVAEAGTGKSRLCFEFLEGCRARGIQVFEGRAVAHGRNIPLLPILEVWRAYFGITSVDDDRAARERIAGRMVLLDQRFAEALPLIFDFLGVADPQRPAPSLEPEARQRQLLDVMRQVIQNLSETQPTVTLIEDLHWMDDTSAEYLEHMVDARSGSRNLLLLNFRPEYHAEWMQKSWYRQIPLTPLGPDAIGELLADLLGSDPSLAALTGPIHARTGGNPFFAEEVAQTLIESGSLEGTRGAYRLVTPIERLEVPATVQAVLAARIDRLPEREKRLLQVAAVIGKDFPEPLLAEVAELPPDELKAAITELRRGEFLQEHAIYPVVEYAFKHPLTQEVSLGSQLRERRRVVHGAVARAIEAQDAEQLDERAPLLAHHYEEAGAALDAARWHKRAAEWVGLTDLDAANRHWGRVRALLRELPADAEAAGLGTAACRQLLNMGWRFGLGLEEARELFEEGRGFASAMGDRLAALSLSQLYARMLCAGGDVAGYLESCLQNQDAALEIDDVGVQSNAAGFLADALSFAGRVSEALQLAEESLERFPRHIPREEWTIGVSPHSWYSFWHGISLGWLGHLPEAFEQMERSRRMTEEDGTPEMRGYNVSFSAKLAFLAGDADRALGFARQCEELSLGLGGEHPVMAAHALRSYAFAHLAAGRASNAIEPARTALEIFERTEQQHSGMAATLLAMALLESGDLAAAQSAAEDALALCRRSTRNIFEALVHGVLARVALRRDGAAAAAAAEASLDEAAALIERTGARALSPRLAEWRAELAAVRGEAALREQLLREAAQGYLEIGAPMKAERLANTAAS